ncbi:hypothetical protein [Flexibacterium corallicola]|uniref:hypothetical protein n=1 Tax=Flexibacterium corallicola TaxID=3037259 RepID=UPI00286F3892|nr:hypothetical protein [Pseudovibrio sp. M1P-2-3]
MAISLETTPAYVEAAKASSTDSDALDAGDMDVLSVLPSKLSEYRPVAVDIDSSSKDLDSEAGGKQNDEHFPRLAPMSDQTSGALIAIQAEQSLTQDSEAASEVSREEAVSFGEMVDEISKGLQDGSN